MMKDLFTPRGLLVRALVLAALYTALHLAGLRSQTSVLCATMQEEGGRQFWGAFAARDPKRNHANIAELFEFYAAGKIKPRVSETFTLDTAAQAIAKLGDRSAVGKLVVEL